MDLFDRFMLKLASRSGRRINLNWERSQKQVTMQNKEWTQKPTHLSSSDKAIAEDAEKFLKSNMHKLTKREVFQIKNMIDSLRKIVK